MPCAGCGGGIANVGLSTPDYDTSDEYVVTYPSGIERVVWGEQAAANEAAAYPGSSFVSRSKYDSDNEAAAKKAATKRKPASDDE